MCDEGMGLRPGKVGPIELMLSRDCLSPLLQACPARLFLQWLYVPAPAGPLRAAGAQLLARYDMGRQTSVFVQDRPLYPAGHICAPGPGTWACVAMPHVFMAVLCDCGHVLVPVCL